MRFLNIKIDKRPFVLLLFLIIVISFMTNAGLAIVSAQGLYPLPELSNDNSLTVKLQLMDAVDAQITHTLPDQKLRLTKVALMKLNTEQQSVEYQTISAFSHLKIVWENMSASESNELAKTISEELENVSLNTLEAVTDANGDAVFSQLENGIYLVEYIEQGSDLSYKIEMAPFLISVPLYLNETGEDAWSYQVEVYPKAGTAETVPDITTKPTVPTKTTHEITGTPPVHVPPRTGEAQEPSKWIILAMLSSMFILLRKKSRSKN